MNIQASCALLFFLLFFNSCSGQDDFCTTIRNKPMASLSDTTKDMMALMEKVKTDMDIMQRCLKLDSIDKMFAQPGVLGALLVSNMRVDHPPTYGDVFKMVDSIRGTADYKRMREQLLTNPAQFDIREEADVDAPREHLSPYQFQAFQTLDKCLSSAAGSKRKVLLYFTATTSVNSRKMEQVVFTDERVKQAIDKDYEAFSLFVDDETKLPDGSETIGDYCFRLQQKRFHSEYQPYFVILDKGGKELRNTGYTGKVEEFMDFLQGH